MYFIGKSLFNLYHSFALNIYLSFSFIFNYYISLRYRDFICISSYVRIFNIGITVESKGRNMIRESILFLPLVRSFPRFQRLYLNSHFLFYYISLSLLLSLLSSVSFSPKLVSFRSLSLHSFSLHPYYLFISYL